MNKKFSTLVASLLLATGVGTSQAQVTGTFAKYATAGAAATKIVEGTYFHLEGTTPGTVLAMVPTTGGAYELQTVTAAATPLADLRYTLWTIRYQQNAEGGYSYVYVNQGSGMQLAVNPTTANVTDAAGALPGTITATTVGGNTSVFKWVLAPDPVNGIFAATSISSAFGAKSDSAVVFVENGAAVNGVTKVAALKYALNNPTGATTAALTFKPVSVSPVLLGVDDLNSMLWKQNPALAASKTKLTFDKDVSGGNPAAVNLFTNQAYKAVNAVGYPFNVYTSGLVGGAIASNAVTTTALEVLETAKNKETLAKAIQAALGTTDANVAARRGFATAWSAAALADLTTAASADYQAELTALEAIAVATPITTPSNAEQVATETAIKKALITYLKSEKDNWAVATAASGTIFDADAVVIALGTTAPATAAGVTAAVTTNYTTPLAGLTTGATTEKNTDYTSTTATAIVPNGWISLQADDNTYLMLDTVYLTNASGRKDLMFNKKVFAELTKNSKGEGLNATNLTRLDYNGRYNFQFVYYPSADSIVIRTAGYAKKESDDSGYSNAFKDLTLSRAGKYPLPTVTNQSATTDYGTEQNLVKIQVLTDGHREVTIGNSEYKGGFTPLYSINTRINLRGASNLVKTTLPSGVYFFNYSSNVPENKVFDGKYQIAKFCGEGIEFANEEEAQLYGQAQDFGHMPRAQWVIEQNPGIAGEQTINIYNREYASGLKATNIQLYKAGDKYFAMFGGAAIQSMDTLTIRAAATVKPVAGILTNKYLGYNVIQADGLSQKSFVMDYFNGIQVGHYVNVSKTAADTTVYVDLKGEKVTLELVPTGDKDETFGYTGSVAPQLYKRAYKIRVYDGSKLVNDNKFIVEDAENEASYAISGVGTPAVFYLKENNQLISEEGDTTCYYALVGGNENIYNRVGVRDASQRFSIEKACSENRIATFALKESDSPLYRRLGVSDPEDGLKDNDVNKYAKIYTVNSTAKEYLYEDASSKYSTGKGINFLGIEGKGDDKLSALYVDTAYVRNGVGSKTPTKMPQYMFAVDVTENEGGYECPYDPSHNTPEYLNEHPTGCPHAVKTKGYKIGRYLINAEDSVQTAKNGKDYIWNVNYTRLSFVWAKHIEDTLVIMRHGKNMDLKKYAVRTDSIMLGDNLHNMTPFAKELKDCKTYADTINASHKYGTKNAVFALRLVDDKPECDFLIESMGDKPIPSDGKGGWVKIQNGVPVVAMMKSYQEAIRDAEIFNIEPTDEIATSNDAITAGEVSVVAGEGKIVVNGAAGKTVVITNLLGQTIANTVLSSDNATIAAPAGVVVVAVEGEAAVKAIVK